jgi:hypothetical protein
MAMDLFLVGHSLVDDLIEFSQLSTLSTSYIARVKGFCNFLPMRARVRQIVCQDEILLSG